MQETTTISLGLFAAWACHDLEELFTMRDTTRALAARTPEWVPIPADVRQDGLSQQHVNLGISLMGAYIAGVSAVGVRSRGRSRLFRGGLLAFGLHGFGHIGVTVALRDSSWAARAAPPSADAPESPKRNPSGSHAGLCDPSAAERDSAARMGKGHFAPAGVGLPVLVQGARLRGRDPRCHVVVSSGRNCTAQAC